MHKNYTKKYEIFQMHKNYTKCVSFMLLHDKLSSVRDTHL